MSVADDGCSCMFGRYDRCPYAARFLHTGKEGFPTLGFQFHCSHLREIFWVSHGFPGARNDKTIVRYDKFLKAMETLPEYRDFKYTVYTDVEQEQEMTGLHVLCDGGYHKWTTTMCGSKHDDEPDVRAWSGLCESVRKDVECLFGILKKRFQIVAGRFLNHDAAGIERTVKVVAVLHNMLLRESGLGDVGSLESHWKTVDEEEAQKYGVQLDQIGGFTLGSHSRTDEPTEVHLGWQEKRDKLIRHYAIALTKGEVLKLRTRADREAAMGNLPSTSQ